MDKLFLCHGFGGAETDSGDGQRKMEKEGAFMTNRRRLLVGVIAAFAALSVPKVWFAADAPKATPLQVTYYFLPG